MGLQEIAWTASALSLLVATATFVANAIERTGRERREEVLRWQKTIVYSIIQDGITDFTEIKLRYLAAAQQVSDLRVPKAEIQDGALKLVLMQLLEAKLISITAEHSYLLNVVESEFAVHSTKQMEALAYDLFVKQQTEKKVRSRIYELVESQPGTYSIDSLHRHFVERQFDVDFDTFNLAVRDLLSRRELFMDTKPDLHQAYPPQPQPASSAPSPSSRNA